MPVKYRGETLYCQRKIMKSFILASRSPRRHDLLTQIGLQFKVHEPAEFIEIQDPERSAHELVKFNAIGKAESVALHYPDALVLGVDTVGAYKDHILEKPKNRKDAKRMLKMLQGTTHQVLSALCLIDTKSGRKQVAVEETHITFLPMSDHDIESYLDKKEYSDKAAAYAAQGVGSIFVQKMNGDYFNVVGLPLQRLNLMLKSFDLNLIDIVK